MSREVSSTGDGLYVFINCDYLPGHNWMSFACWYSINRNLPDAKVAVAYKRAEPRWDLFHWTHKCKVRLMAYAHEPVWDVFGGQITVKAVRPYTMAVRAYNKDNVGPNEAKEDAYSTFVSYFEGCGRFNVDAWINKLGAPFMGALRKFRTLECTADEIKVLELWERMFPLFSSV